MNDLLHQFSQHPMLSGGLALALGGAILAWLRRIPYLGLVLLRRRMITTVEIRDRDPGFRWAVQWLAAHPVMGRARELLISTDLGPPVAHGACVPGMPMTYSTPEPNVALMPAPGVHLVRFRGLPMLVTHRRQQIWLSGGYAYEESISFRFFGAGREVVEALVGEIRDIGLKAIASAPAGVRVLVPRDDTWIEAPYHPRRSPESLALADGLLEELATDIRSFQASTDWYADRGIPYHRGYLLHGPPGTGKTTTVAVLAGQLRMGIAVLNLSDSNLTDHILLVLLRNLSDGVILLIEDIDCVVRSRASDKTSVDAPRVTMLTLLNAIDGIGAKAGRVLFLTTNHPDRLDPALVRPGRVDRQVELGYATPDQARRMFTWFFTGHPLGEGWIGRLADSFASRLVTETTPAAIQEHFLRHRDDPAAAVQTFGESRSGFCP